MINKELLEVLACPKCKGAVELSSDGETLLCRTCLLGYPIDGDIPAMLIDMAIPIDKEPQKN